MKTLAQLDQLNLDADTKTQVTDLVQTLLNEAKKAQDLFGTAQLNGLNPSAWLENVLTKLPTWPNSRINELLPLTPEFIETLREKIDRWWRWTLAVN